MIYPTERSRSFEPVAERILAELDGVARGQLPDDAWEKLEAGFGRLIPLDAELEARFASG